MTRFETLSQVRDLFAQGGVVESDYPAIRTAVVQHCLPRELMRTHPHWRLTSLLKDADGLDRVVVTDPILQSRARMVPCGGSRHGDSSPRHFELSGALLDSALS